VKGSTRGMQNSGGAVLDFHGDIFPVLQPRSLAFRRGGVGEPGEEEAEQGRWRTGWNRGSRGWTGFFLPRAAPASGVGDLNCSGSAVQARAFPRPAASPAGRRRRGSPAGRRPRPSHGRPPVPSPPAPPSPPLLLSSCGGQGGTPMGRRRGSGRCRLGRLYRAAPLGSGVLERTDGMRRRGHATAFGGQRGGQRCREGRRPWVTGKTIGRK
jgi:hypothetical protein